MFGTFTSGSMSIDIPVLSIIPLSSIGIYESSNFNVQHTVVNSLPTASSVVVGALTFKELPVYDANGNPVVTGGVPQIANTLVLPLTIKAVEFTGTTWQNVTGAKPVHLLVTVA